MGGISKIKGTLPLLMAISKLSNLENITVLIAGYCKPVNFQSLNLFHKFTHLVRKILNLEAKRILGWINNRTQGSNAADLTTP